MDQDTGPVAAAGQPIESEKEALQSLGSHSGSPGAESKPGLGVGVGLTRLCSMVLGSQSGPSPIWASASSFSNGMTTLLQGGWSSSMCTHSISPNTLDRAGLLARREGC